MPDFRIKLILHCCLLSVLRTCVSQLNADQTTNNKQQDSEFNHVNRFKFAVIQAGLNVGARVQVLHVVHPLYHQIKSNQIKVYLYSTY